MLAALDDPLGEEVNIRADKHEVNIKCKNIDEIITKENVSSVLEKNFALIASRNPPS